VTVTGVEKLPDAGEMIGATLVTAEQVEASRLPTILDGDA
jgi:hypothetical protein